jgi:DNA-binding SARP family transcriptional activator
LEAPKAELPYDDADPVPPPLNSDLRFRLLGGLEATLGAARLDTGARKQRVVLAALLLAQGRTVMVTALTEAVWGARPPERADASLQSYVSTLRRMLEPERRPRAEPTVLVTHGAGYAIPVSRDQLDVTRFEDLVGEGRRLLAAQDLPAAAAKLRNALAMWAPLLPEFDGEDFAREEATRLASLNAVAVELSFQARLGLGEHQILLPDLEAATARDPLNEGLWGLLALARYRSGRQSDALAAVAECRRVLRDEIGVDPGPALRQLEADLLRQSPDLDLDLAEPGHIVTAPPAAAEAAGGPGPDRTPTPNGVAGVPTARQPAAPALVGRAAELAVVERELHAASQDQPRVLTIEGEAGVGKTSLLENLARRAVVDDALVVWGRCVPGEARPVLWPWTQVLDSILAALPVPDRDRWREREIGDLLDRMRSPVATTPAAARPPNAGFRLMEQVADLLATVAADRQLVVAFDDVQWADDESCALIEHVAGRLAGRVLLALAMRDAEARRAPALAPLLAALPRVPGHRRVALTGLDDDGVGALVARTFGRMPDGETVGSIVARTNGNPFFVRELTLLLDAGGRLPGRGDAVPAGVRDVVGSRIAGLPAATQRLLSLAALIGRDVDLGLLARAADLDVESCLDELEPAVGERLLGPSATDPFAYRISHDLVAEAIAMTTPPLQTSRLHARIADALERMRGGDDRAAERLAHHLWHAGPLVDSARTADALVRAAEVAMHRYAYRAAEQHLRRAIDLRRKAGDDEGELAALQVLVAVFAARIGHVATPVDVLERAEALALRLGRDREAFELLHNRWGAASMGLDLELGQRLIAELRRRAAGSADPVMRFYEDHDGGVLAWQEGRIGDARAHFDRSVEVRDAAVAAVRGERSDVLDLVVLAPLFRAMLTGTAGDVAGSHALFDDYLREHVPAGPYPAVMYGAIAGTAAALEGDARRALEVVAVAREADPDEDFTFYVPIVKAVHAWAWSMTHDPREGAARLRTAIDEQLAGVGRTTLHAWFILLAEIHLALGEVPLAAAAAADAADALDRYGERHSESLVRLVQARVLHARGAPAAEVRAAWQAARDLAETRGALMFVARADALRGALDLE